MVASALASALVSAHDLAGVHADQPDEPVGEAQRAPGQCAPAPDAGPAQSRFEPIASLIKSIFHVPAVTITLNGTPTVPIRGIYRSFLEIPLIRKPGSEEAEVIGALRILDTAERQFTDHDCTLLEGFANLVVEQVELWAEATRDVLTGTMTRRAFVDALKKTHAAHQRHGGNAVLVIFDLDHFKSINDTHGHGVGDAVLKQAARAVRRELRVEDSFGRIGGEEFAVILENATAASAAEVTERIRAAIEHEQLPGGEDIGFTASFGVAALSAVMVSTEEWMEAADGALYRAKESGRNRLCVAQPPAVALN
ncbi:MAG: GGDEF domain-containing protein [Pararhodobacter sp.]|nr:GGDEF domain-containing protein [Pararhodobacter sp.]